MLKAIENRKRSLVKSLTYRLLSMSVDLAVAYYVTREIMLALGIVAFVNGYSTILYYVHERAWGHIYWGRIPLPAQKDMTPPILP